MLGWHVRVERQSIALLRYLVERRRGTCYFHVHERGRSNSNGTRPWRERQLPYIRHAVQRPVGTPI